MGEKTSSRTAFVDATSQHTSGSGPSTANAEREVRATGKLNPLVDPSQYGVIRPSRCRFIQQDNGLWRLTVGTPYPVETRADTTSSMGDNVDVILNVLPSGWEMITEVLPGSDPQIAMGIFNDLQDRVILCRPQFEALAERIVPQLTYMVPCRNGQGYAGGAPYGLFGAAYLTAPYLVRIGLKSYDFTVTDTEAHDDLSYRLLTQIYGPDVLAKAAENGFPFSSTNLPSTKQIVQDLLNRCHPFLFHVGDRRESIQSWSDVYGKERVIRLPDTRYLPHAQAAVIGLTEGTLGLCDLHEFFKNHGVPADVVRLLEASLVNIPLGAQALLPNFGRRPMAGALFREKGDLWPMTPEEIATYEAEHGNEGETKPDVAGKKVDEDLEWL